MRVKMKHQITGTRDGETWPAPGGEIVVSDDEGAQLCSQGMAEPVAEAPKTESRPAPPAPEKREAPAKKSAPRK